MLRLEATGYNAKELRCRRSLDNSGQIIDRLAGMADRFAALDYETLRIGMHTLFQHVGIETQPAAA